MFESTLFGDLEPRGSREDDRKLISKLNQKAKAPSSSRGNSIKEKMEWIRREVNRHLSFIFDKVEACREEDRLRAFFDNFIQQDKGSIDTETLGLDYFKDKIYGWSTWAQGEKSLYVPVLHKGYVTGDVLDRQISPEFIGKQLERVKNSNTKLVFHNAKFDMHMIYHNFGVMLPCWWDTMIASRLLHSSEKDHSLKYQYNVKVKKDTGKPYDFKTLFSGVDPNSVPIDIMTPYAAGDTFETLGLQEYQEEEFKKYPGIYNVFKNIEMPLLPVIVDMEERGVCVDLDVLKQMKEKYLVRYEEAKKVCLDELDKYSDKINSFNLRNPGKLSNPINLGSPTQVAILFYDIIGLPESQKYKRGTGKKVLELYKDKNEFIKKLINLRDAEKLVNGFINSIPEFIKEDGKVHPDFVQIKGTGNTNEEDEENGADTGRFSCLAPNLQQIPGRGEKSELRKMFKASEGYIMMSSDYSQQEIRVLAHCSGDEEMINAYKNNKDLYAIMAAKVYNKPYEDCLEFYPEGTKLIIDGKEIICKKKEHTNKEGKKRRSSCKSLVLGIMYGRGQASIAEQIGSTLEEAKDLIDTFYKEFPNVRNWMTRVENSCSINGYVDTLAGRRRELPDALLEEYEFKNKGGRPKDFNPLSFMSPETANELDYTVDEETKNYYINKLKKAYGWKAKEDVINEAKAEGIEIKDNSQYKAKAMRQAVNTTIQGSSADMSKLAMLYCAQNEELTRLGFRMLFPVHDEIIAEAPKETAKRCGELMSEMMVKAAAKLCPSVPFKCDVEFLERWGGDSLECDENGNWFVADSH